MFGHITAKLRDIKLQGTVPTPFCGFRHVTCGSADAQTDVWKLICTFANVSLSPHQELNMSVLITREFIKK